MPKGIPNWRKRNENDGVGTYSIEWIHQPTGNNVTVLGRKGGDEKAVIQVGNGERGLDDYEIFQEKEFDSILEAKRRAKSFMKERTGRDPAFKGTWID